MRHKISLMGSSALTSRYLTLSIAGVTFDMSTINIRVGQHDHLKKSLETRAYATADSHSELLEWIQADLSDPRLHREFHKSLVTQKNAVNKGKARVMASLYLVRLV